MQWVCVCVRPSLTTVGDRQILGAIHADNAVERAQLYVVFQIFLRAEQVGRHFILVDQVDHVDHVMAGEDIAEEVIGVVPVSFSLLR